MTEEEYDIIDQLYFVTSYAELVDGLDLEPDVVNATLFKLVAKEWVNAFTSIDAENRVTDLGQDIEELYFLASKKGLLKHNSR